MMPIFVLDSRDQPIHAMRDGATIGPEGFESDRPTLTHFISRLRAQMSDLRSGGEDAAEALVEAGVVETLLPRGDQHQTDHPHISRFDIPQGGEYLHVAVQRMRHSLGRSPTSTPSKVCVCSTTASCSMFRNWCR